MRLISIQGSSRESNRWTSIARADLPEWNRKLLNTDAHYRQYPYWCEPYHRSRVFVPRFYSYQTHIGDVAYVCIVECKIWGAKFCLIQRGPVTLNNESLSEEAIRDLIRLGNANGYAFMRFTNDQKSIEDMLMHFPASRRVEAFPFYRDPPKSLIVTQMASDGEMLKSFQPVARREIGYAENIGYTITHSDAPEDYRRIWPMFERIAEYKAFHLTDRSLDSWLDVVQAARKHGCTRLYTASLGSECLSAIHFLRYGNTVEFMLGALDVRLLGKKPSPSSLIHWRAMRDFHRCGCQRYNLGGPGDGVHNKVYSFKRKFRPELQVAGPPITVVLNPLVYRSWDLMVLKGWLGSKRILRAGFAKATSLIREFMQKSTNIYYDSQ